LKIHHELHPSAGGTRPARAGRDGLLRTPEVDKLTSFLGGWKMASSSENRSVSGLPSDVISFGPFELSRRTCELRKYGSWIRLQPKPLELLYTLIESAGRGGDARGVEITPLARRHFRRF